MLEKVLSLLFDEAQCLKKEGTQHLYLNEDRCAWLQAQAQTKMLADKQPSSSLTAPQKNPPKKETTTFPVINNTPNEAPKPKLSAPPTVTLPEGSKETKWAFLKKRVLECPECNKHVKPGKKVVFGVGSLNADIFFCGEAPGAEEETLGEPFVGPAGQLLTKIIQAMGLSRETVYIGNIMNWRPEMPTAYGNRPPTLEEMHYCLPFLKAQLDIVKPKVIVALGATAVNGLLGPDPKRKISAVRGSWQSFENIPLLITYHPSYLLRNNTLKTKRMVWEDMLKVMEKIKLPISEKQQSFFL